MKDYKILYGSLEDYCKAVGLSLDDLIRIKEAEIKLMKKNYTENYIFKLDRLTDEELEEAFMIREEIDRKMKLLNRFINYKKSGGREIW